MEPPFLEGKGIIQKILILLTTFNLFAASWYVLNNDIYFHTDIARDFLILKEIEEKKIVLIGARAGIEHLYHGPLWYYLNFPIYMLSSGNPVAVGWFWIFLVIIFLLICYKIAKKFFTRETGFIFIYLLSNYLIAQTREFSHPHGAFLVMPLFFYTFWRYVNTFKLKYLAFNVLLVGFIIQFEMAIGIPLLLLSFFYVLVQLLKKSKVTHIFIYFLILLPLSTFVVFDLRHDFIQLNGITKYIESRNNSYINYPKILENRSDFISNVGVPLMGGSGELNRIVFLLFSIIIFLLVKKGVNRKLYLTVIYFYFGIFVITLFNKGALLGHFVMPFIPIVFLTFSSLVTTKYRKVFYILLFFIVMINEANAMKFIQKSQEFIGKSDYSWKFLHKYSQEIFRDAENDFGYFVFSPDAFAYEPKYAMYYMSKLSKDKTASSFNKRHLTYIVATPPPPNDPYLNEEWWITNNIRITKSPRKVITYPNGYKSYRYELSDEELSMPFDQTADTGLNFR